MRRALVTPKADVWVTPTGSDTNSGTSLSPVRTLAKADLLVPENGMVRVTQGTYAAVRTTRYGVRWLGDEGAIVSATGSGAVWQNEANSALITGFEITGARIGIYNLGSNVTISRNHIHHVFNTCTSLGGAGIVCAQPGASVTVEDNLVHDIGSFTPRCQWYQGIYMQWQHATVRRNTIYASSNGGISLWHAPYDILIEDNDSYQNGLDGVDLGGSEDTCDFITIRNNRFHDCPYGVVEGGLIGTHNIYSGNTIFGCPLGNVLKTGHL
jgi:nitrous oxidase accessory protein NosD